MPSGLSASSNSALASAMAARASAGRPARGVDDGQPDQAVPEAEALPGPPPGVDGLFGLGHRAVPPAGDQVPDRHHPVGPGRPSLVPGPPEQLQTLLEQPEGTLEVALGGHHEGLVVERVGGPGGIAEPALDGQGLPVEPRGGREVLLPPGDPPGPGEGLGPRRRRLPPTTWYDRFPGGCVTSRLRSATDPDGRFAAEAPAVLEFASRQALDQRLEERSGGRLHLDPVPRDSS
jgi:hypothetical protein